MSDPIKEVDMQLGMAPFYHDEELQKRLMSTDGNVDDMSKIIQETINKEFQGRPATEVTRTQVKARVSYILQWCITVELIRDFDPNHLITFLI